MTAEYNAIMYLLHGRLLSLNRSLEENMTSGTIVLSHDEWDFLIKCKRDVEMILSYVEEEWADVEQWHERNK